MKFLHKQKNKFEFELMAAVHKDVVCVYFAFLTKHQLSNFPKTASFNYIYGIALIHSRINQLEKLGGCESCLSSLA